MRLLLVEDDLELAGVLVAGLREHGIDADHAATFDAGLARAEDGGHDLVVLDVMLPGGSGFDLCARLRARRNATPILMLTARDAVDDRVRGLESGADDYLVKPFEFRELLARVRALGRRSPRLAPQRFEAADFFADLGTREVRRAGRPITVTAKEFALLECFVRNAGVVLDRRTITAQVWDDNHDPFTNALEVLVRRLRRKIDDGHDVKLIHTLRGAGYRFGA